MTATPVAPLARPADCDARPGDMRCAVPAQWRVGLFATACDEHLARVLRAALVASDGFAPVVPVPLKRGNW